MRWIRLLALVAALMLPVPCPASETLSIVYQNDLHGWIFPSSNGVGIDKTADLLSRLFRDEPSSFYAVAGDLFTGPNLPDSMKGEAELKVWNRFRDQLSNQGFGDRIFLSAGNHEFDYGVPAPEAFSGGLLCANIVQEGGLPYYVPFRIVRTEEGLRVGFVGLLLERNPFVLRTLGGRGLDLVPKLATLKRFLPEMGELDLTVLMVHDDMSEIVMLAEALGPEAGVDVILSGHNHLLLNEPLVVNGIPILQAGAMNGAYGRAELTVERGKVVALRNELVPLVPSLLHYAMMRMKEKADELDGKTVAVLESSLEGVYGRDRESTLGNFVTDAFRWATRADVAMTNSSSLRRDFRVYPGEPFELREGHFKSMTPFGNLLVKGEVRGQQIMQLLEGEAVSFQNQVSGLTYTMDVRKPAGSRIVGARINGRPIEGAGRYTLVHNSYCTRPENMEQYLHLKPGAVAWETTPLVDHEVLSAFARKLQRIRYPVGGEGRITRLP